jgi:hypothetical protein
MEQEGARKMRHGAREQWAILPQIPVRIRQIQRAAVRRGRSEATQGRFH